MTFAILGSSGAYEAIEILSLHQFCLKRLAVAGSADVPSALSIILADEDVGAPNNYSQSVFSFANAFGQALAMSASNSAGIAAISTSSSVPSPWEVKV